MNMQNYWNQKILGWEKSRYSWRSYLNPGSWSVRTRLHTAADFLSAQGQGFAGETLTIFELGCGSGELLRHMKKPSGLQYEGWDISDVAILQAIKRFHGSGFRFRALDLESAREFSTADFTVLLGVTDWISKASLQVLLTKIESPRVLISYTEDKKSLRNRIYRLYRQVHDQDAYQTTLYTDLEFRQLYQRCGWVLERDLSTRVMSPGRLLCLKKNISN